MKKTRIFLSVILAAVTCSSMAQGIIIYKSNGTTEKLPYVAVDSIVPYAGDKAPDLLPPKYVDLGLPSGTLWADRNVGAAAPEAIGGYYAGVRQKRKPPIRGTAIYAHYNNVVLHQTLSVLIT